MLQQRTASTKATVQSKLYSISTQRCYGFQYLSYEIKQFRMNRTYTKCLVLLLNSQNK